MPQSNVIFFYIFAAFVIFITMRGELSVYMGFLLASPVNQKAPTAKEAQGGSNSGGLKTPGGSGVDDKGVTVSWEDAAKFL